MSEVKSGFWNDTHDFVGDGNPLEARLKNLMRRRGMRPLQRLMSTLLGAAPGGTASGTYSRVTGQGNNPVTSVGELGGVRAIDTRTQINRATTAADDTRITNLITKNRLPSINVRDISGNGK